MVAAASVRVASCESRPPGESTGPRRGAGRRPGTAVALLALASFPGTAAAQETRFEISPDLRTTREAPIRSRQARYELRDFDRFKRGSVRARRTAPTGKPIRFRIRVEGPRLDFRLHARLDGFLEAWSGKIRTSPGGVHAVRLRAIRRVDGLVPRFARWADLSRTFQPLRDVLARSPNLRVREEKRVIRSFVEGSYDKAPQGRPGVQRAKATLLNVFGKMSAAPMPKFARRASWFDYVHRLESIGRERFIAHVHPELFEAVLSLQKGGDDGYVRAPAGDHRKNFPQYPGARLESVKSIEPSGFANLQLTVFRARDAVGNLVTLLDADIDEHASSKQHFYDAAFRHPFSGGTDPYLVYELLGFALGARDLGYALVRR